MRRFFVTLLLGFLLGAGALWYWGEGREGMRVRDVEVKAGEALEGVKGTVASVAGKVKEAMGGKLEAFELRSGDIKDDMARTGQVVRRKARDVGGAVADATADARITAEIKAKLVRHPTLSALQISVNTTGGRVTLAGPVASPDLIAEATLLALETEGVREVISTLQVQKGE